MRKIVTALVLVPLAVVLIVLAVANRQPVVISFDPFDHAQPAFTVTLPLFALVLALIIAGVIVGGMAAWLRQRKWRRAARRAQGELAAVRVELDRLKRRELGTEAIPGAHPSALTLPPPAA
jgi:uncharacterized integral membrane protein